MKTSTLTILIALHLLTGCGGKSNSEDKGFIGTSSEEIEINITISTSNQSLSISPSSKQKIFITGSNNEITISTNPASVRVTGSDNTIRIKNKSKVNILGAGNIILDLEGSYFFE
jgi:hypothetical protein